ncbi:F-box protein At5g07610-like [Rutidosis leptorrhynchoides]|uniref:F-box protein At5g07610-like n=1 Tax=Rutidosis leptorrhynchoides TaxID=125765 RepID=UPI003A9928CA
MMNTEVKSNLLNKSEADDDQNSIADHSNHESAELIGCNVDLLTKIFLGLPAKSIVRFKSVSKQSQSLLTLDPRFTTMFDKLFNSSGLYYHELHVPFDVKNPSTPPFRTLDFYPDGIRIVQSCNGLLLCRCDTNEYEYEYEELIRFMGLAYHPTECVHYKLVCILRAGHTQRGGGQGFSEHGDRMYDIQIYYSETGEWKKLKNQRFTPLDYTEFRYGVYWNGAFHWAPSCPNPMYLSLDDEQLKDLPLPSTLPVRFGYFRKRPLYFGESRGHLHLVDTIHEKNPSSLNVYEMLKDHSGWFIKYQLDFHELFATYPKMTHTYRKFDGNKFEFGVLDVVRGEEEEDTFMVVKVVDNIIMRYNILDKSFIKLCDIPYDNIDPEVEGYFIMAGQNGETLSDQSICCNIIDFSGYFSQLIKSISDVLDYIESNMIVMYLERERDKGIPITLYTNIGSTLVNSQLVPVSSNLPNNWSLTCH